MPAHAEIDGIDRGLLFGNTRLPLLLLGRSPFPSRSRTTKVREGLALVYTNYSIVFLGIETHFRSPGSSPGTLVPRVGQGGVENPFYDLRQVSNCLDPLDVHFSDQNEVNRAHAGSFYAIFDPPLKSEITKYAIVPERGTRSVRTFGRLFKYVFASFSRPSRSSTFMFPPSRDVDTFG